MSSAFSLVVFDVGSVLVEAGRTLADDFQMGGFSVTDEWLAAFEARLAVLPRPSIGAIDIDEYYARFAEASEGMFTAEDGRSMANTCLVREYDGIARVFDALEVAGIECALFSNINAAEWARMFPGEGSSTDFPALPRARYRFASHLIGAEKPEARAYLEVERGTGRSGDAIIFFDDREENVEAARARAWTAELIDHRGDTAAQLLRWLRHYEVIA